ALGSRLTISEDGTQWSQAGCPEGTTVEVADLFYNVPARRKFLKSTQTEYNAVAETLVRQALAFPSVHFVLTHNGRKTLEFPGVDSREQRVLQVLGKSAAEHFMPVAGLSGDFSLEGFISLATEHRKNAAQIYFLVNDRYVQDRLMLRALLDPYRTLLPSGRYPFGVLYLAMPPDTVDVNVHPAKMEIRFHDENSVFHLIRSTVFRSLNEFTGQTLAVQTPQNSTARATPEIPRQTSMFPQSQHTSSTKRERDLDEVIQSAVSAFGDRLAAQERAETLGSIQGQSVPTGTAPSASTTTHDGFTTPVSEQKPVPAPVTPQILFDEHRRFVPRMQLNNVYMVGYVNGEPDLIIIDQHAAHERILFEQFRASRAGHCMPSQNLLIPLTWDVAPSDVDIVCSHLDALRTLGFEIEYFGGETFNVTAIPATLDLERSAQLLQDCISDLAQGQKDHSAAEDLENALLERLACHAAVRAGQALSLEEMESLGLQLCRTPNGGTCPHGRPTTLRLSESDLKKHFKRD
ncbi:MAG TPA: DNA mismatch repair endonuclease MutL, partial [bacterium]|nr:DNA mismatch repair endonuclease MutL [bacterium]